MMQFSKNHDFWGWWKYNSMLSCQSIALFCSLNSVISYRILHLILNYLPFRDLIQVFFLLFFIIGISNANLIIFIFMIVNISKYMIVKENWKIEIQGLIRWNFNYLCIHFNFFFFAQVFWSYRINNFLLMKIFDKKSIGSFF